MFLFKGSVTWVAIILIAVCLRSAAAQDAPKSVDEIARELANPNTPLASLTFKNQYRWYDGNLPGASKQSNYTLLFQPVFPFSLGKTASGGDATLFIRPAFPLILDQPTFDPSRSGGFRGVTGMADIGFDIGYGVTEKNGVLWAVGMVGTLPTGTRSELTGGQLRLGPEFLLAKFEKWGVYGIFPSHQWNVSGWRNEQYSTTQVQLFLTFLPGGGWKVGTTPVISYDWIAQKWTIPVNLTVSKTIKVGELPVNLGLEVNYYVKKPNTFGPSWYIGFSITPVVKNIFAELFQKSKSIPEVLVLEY